MNELFPIVRRKRRPFLVEESVPDGPPMDGSRGRSPHQGENIQQPTANIEQPVADKADESRLISDAKATSTRKSR